MGRGGRHGEQRRWYEEEGEGEEESSAGTLASIGLASAALVDDVFGHATKPVGPGEPRGPGGVGLISVGY